MAGADNTCGNHRYFVADVATDHDSGTVHIICICTSCGESFVEPFQITSPKG